MGGRGAWGGWAGVEEAPQRPLCARDTPACRLWLSHAWPTFPPAVAVSGDTMAWPSRTVPRPPRVLGMSSPELAKGGTGGWGAVSVAARGRAGMARLADSPGGSVALGAHGGAVQGVGVWGLRSRQRQAFGGRGEADSLCQSATRPSPFLQITPRCLSDTFRAAQKFLFY